MKKLSEFESKCRIYKFLDENLEMDFTFKSLYNSKLAQLVSRKSFFFAKALERRQKKKPLDLFVVVLSFIKELGEKLPKRPNGCFFKERNFH